MSTLARTLTLIVLTSTLVGCDSSSELDECVYPEDGTRGAADEPVTSGRRRRCPSSVFTPEDVRAREVFGVVRRGEGFVSGALVRAEPTPGFEMGSGAIPTTAVTDGVGFFAGLRPSSYRYDLLVKLDRPGASDPDVLVYRGLAGRYVEPSIEGPLTAARAWTARVDVALDRAVPAGHSVAFFANGFGVYGVTGDLTAGLTVSGATYSLPATLHVVEFETAGGLAAATAYGTASVTADAGRARLVSIALQPIPFFVEPMLVAEAPVGFSPVKIDVAFSFSRTSGGTLASAAAGSSPRLPIIPNAGYTYRARATKDGVSSDSGEISFDVLLPRTEIELPSPPAIVSPAEGEARGARETLLVDGDGVFEHVLVPESVGPTIRIVAGQREAALPDVTTLGATAPAGAYVWTVRSYPKARFAEELAGLDARRNRPMTVSRPRSIVLR
ncbi:MAG: hypothetical protein KF795_33455 [Labilithrix sp.]|nr:hypothetical protein [Labilithrix sp.]